MAAAKVTVGLHVSDHGLDGAAASQFALDDAKDATLLAGDEDAAWIGRAVTTTAFAGPSAEIGCGHLFHLQQESPNIRPRLGCLSHEDPLAPPFRRIGSAGCRRREG